MVYAGFANQVSASGSNVVKVSISGLKELTARLNEMEIHLQYRMLVDVMKKSLERALEEAQARAPVGGDYWGKNAYTVPGRLKRSFRIKKMKNTTPYLLEVQLQNTAYYALWVENGHNIVRGKKSARRIVGFAKAHPFMRPTYESQKGSIINQVADGIRAGLLRRGF